MRMGVLRFRGEEEPGLRERGANLVEFALLAPLLIILVLGIVEFGWKFGQFNDVRHGVREGARFAAVNAGDEVAIKDHVCGSMDAISAGMTGIDITLTDGTSATSDADDGAGDIGDTATVRVDAQVESLTGLGLIEIFLPATLSSEVDFRLEQPSDWSGGAQSC